MRCLVKCCKNYSGKKGISGNVRFYSFPKDSIMYRKWRLALGDIKLSLDKKSHVCSEHFEESSFRPWNIILKEPIAKRLLNDHAVPTLKLWIDGENPELHTATDALSKSIKRKYQKISTQLIEEHTDSNMKRVKELDNTKYKDSSSQTEEEKDDQIFSLTIELDTARRVINDLKLTIAKCNNDLSQYEKLFTPGQRSRIISHSDKIPQWSHEDISNAMTLYCTGSKAYRLLRKRGFPLPEASTLNRHAGKISIQPGFLEPVLSSICNKDGLEKYFTLSFDEMKIKETYEYDHSQSKVMRPVSQALVVMAKGLFANWQQVVYYNFDKTVNSELILNIISKLEGAGLVPIAMVCDMGTKNFTAHKTWEISTIKPSFKSRAGHEVFVFYDTPHLLKLLRNHLIDSGYIHDGRKITIEPIKRILQLQGRDFGIAHKLTGDHFPPKGSPKRQNVRLAARLISNSVSSALKRLREESKRDGSKVARMPQETKKTAQFIGLMNDWFDLFNTKQKIKGQHFTKKAFGIDIQTLKDQKDLMTQVYKFIEEMRPRIKFTKKVRKGIPPKSSKKARLPFQAGIMQNIRSLLGMYEYLNQKIKTPFYIMTARLNQDSLERFFGNIRYKGGGLNDHPSPVDFKYRLRSCIVGSYNHNPYL